jgi:hypothetical protein
VITLRHYAHPISAPGLEINGPRECFKAKKKGRTAIGGYETPMPTLNVASDRAAPHGVCLFDHLSLFLTNFDMEHYNR